MSNRKGLEIGTASIGRTVGVNPAVLAAAAELKTVPNHLLPTLDPARTSHVRGSESGAESRGDGSGQTRKYGNKKKRVDGYLFDSAKEAKMYVELKALEACGRIRNLIVHPKYDLYGRDGSVVCTYTADFSYTETVPGSPQTERRVVVDVKSPATSRKDVYRLKRKLFKASYGLDITER